MCVVQEGLPTDYMAKGGLADIERLGLATRRLQDYKDYVAIKG